MLERLDRISDRTGIVVTVVGLLISLSAALLAPQDVELGAWVRLVIWHGMLKWACIVAVFAVGVIALLRLVLGMRRIDEWGRALQFVLLPAWVVAVAIGAISARLVWNDWNLTERRMTMSLLYTIVAAAAVIVELMMHGSRAGAVGRIVTALAMAAGLGWIATIPAGEDVHPASAVLSSGDVGFKIAAFAMMGGCLIALLGAAVPVHHWLARGADHEETAPTGS